MLRTFERLPITVARERGRRQQATARPYHSHRRSMLTCSLGTELSLEPARAQALELWFGILS